MKYSKNKLQKLKELGLDKSLVVDEINYELKKLISYFKKNINLKDLFIQDYIDKVYLFREESLSTKDKLMLDNFIALCKNYSNEQLLASFIGTLKKNTGKDFYLILAHTVIAQYKPFSKITKRLSNLKKKLLKRNAANNT